MLISPAMNYSFSIYLLDVFFPLEFVSFNTVCCPRRTVCGLCYSSKPLVGSQIDFFKKKKKKLKGVDNLLTF